MSRTVGVDSKPKFAHCAAYMNSILTLLTSLFFCPVYSKTTEYEDIRKSGDEGYEDERTARGEDAEDAFSNEHIKVTGIIFHDDGHVAKTTEDYSKESILGNEIATKEGETEMTEEEDGNENNSRQQQAERDCSETLRQNGKSHDVTLTDVKDNDINSRDAVFVGEVEAEEDSFRIFSTWNQQKGDWWMRRRNENF